MGTWEGHISPGVAFYSFGIVFCFQFSRQFLRAKFNPSSVRNRSSAKGTSTHHVTSSLLSPRERIASLFRGFPIDAFLKVLYGVGAAMAELFYPPGTNKLYMVNSYGKWVHLSEWQHFTMYISFAVSGLVDIASHKMVRERVIVAEKAAVAMAFYITSLLLFYHRHGKTELEQEAHELLLYATLVMCLVLTLQMWLPDDTRLLWTQTIAVMIMGSWLFHMAFILFPLDHKPWHEGDDMNGMVLPIFFCWHILFNCALAAAIFASQYYLYKKRYGAASYLAVAHGTAASGGTGSTGSDEMRLIMADHDDDDDDETIFTSSGRR